MAQPRQQRLYSSPFPRRRRWTPASSTAHCRPGPWHRPASLPRLCASFPEELEELHHLSWARRHRRRLLAPFLVALPLPAQHALALRVRLCDERGRPGRPRSTRSDSSPRCREPRTAPVLPCWRCPARELAHKRGFSWPRSFENLLPFPRPSSNAGHTGGQQRAHPRIPSSHTWRRPQSTSPLSTRYRISIQVSARG